MEGVPATLVAAFEWNGRLKAEYQVRPETDTVSRAEIPTEAIDP